MIAILSGIVSEKLTDTIILDVNGVGYGLNITAEDHGSLKIGEAAKLYIHEHIREQSHDLFGFISRETKALFEQLLSVNGVGPKMALSMLSIGSNSGVKQAIATGDVAFIKQANGVGKRLAERVVVDLKDKVGLVGVDLQSTGILQSSDALQQDEAMVGLMALGYTEHDAMSALKGVDSGLSVEDRIKQALKVNK